MIVPKTSYSARGKNVSVVAVTFASAVEALPVLSVYFVTVLRLERSSDGTTASNAGQIVFFMYDPPQPPAFVFVVFMRKAAEEPVELYELSQNATSVPPDTAVFANWK